MRRDVSRIQAYMGGVRSQKIVKYIRNLYYHYNVSNETQLQEKCITLRLKITAKAKEIKNKDNQYLTKIHNQQFERDPKQFYRNIKNSTITVSRPPTEEDVSVFWRNIYENSPIHNQAAHWIDTIEVMNRDKQEMENLLITTMALKTKIMTTSNFKCPGPDNLTNFWLKQIYPLHNLYTTSFNRILNNEESIPVWLTKGTTSLIPKSANETHLANKYRPICCLPTTYKILTALISDNVYDHLQDQQLLEAQQKGCIRNSYGTKDQLLLNKTILDNCRTRSTNLSTAWIDYKKAFDSVPHSWIMKCAALYKLAPNVVTFLSNSMPMWRTNIRLNHNNGAIEVNEVMIRRGIFQGDSLSPLLFCLTLDPLSKLLNDTNNGYNLCSGRHNQHTTINHSLYMDDLKLYAKSDRTLQEQLQLVHQFSTDIHMEFGLDKCAKLTIRKGKYFGAGAVELDDGVEIGEIADGQTYKYLGIEESTNVEHQRMREKMMSEYKEGLKTIMRTKLSPKNKIIAINQIVIPPIQYSFGIVDWPQQVLNKIDSMTRRILTHNKIICKDQSHDRIYLPRAKGGMGLMEIDTEYKGAIISLAQYIHSSTDRNMQLVKQHHQQLPQTKSILKMSEVFTGTPLCGEPGADATVEAKRTRAKFVRGRHESGGERWRRSGRAGPFAKLLEEDYIDKKVSLDWLKKGVLRYDSERIIIAAQDQALYTNGVKHLLGLADNDRCRFCRKAQESSNHLLSGCEVLLGEGRYTVRHNHVCRIIHWRMCQRYGVPVCDSSWKHEPPPITENDRVKITYDLPIPVSRHIRNGALRPDIVLFDKRLNKAFIVDVCVPNDFGIGRQEREKVVKYQDLKNDIKDTHQLDEAEVIPVVIGATGIVKKNLHQYIASLPADVTIAELQSEVVRESVSILKRALGCRLVA